MHDESLNEAMLDHGAEGDLLPAIPVESRVRGMFKTYFLDYASYVILERAVPGLNDGLKPVQRRLMHALREMDDGRFHKVANVIGQTMKYHPHGDASIGDALVQLGQKDLLVDTQGNWGNVLTGDSAAAPRYIETRLSKFALHVAFNPKITQWQGSYDGRNKEPIDLPMKFPLLLAQGAEGIAVGLSTKIMPHNFNELIDATVKHLKGRSFTILPDFPTGGIADMSNYQDGVRGGKVRVRARITVQDKNTLVISEVPYGTTTTSLIDSIIKANDKGKVKLKKVEDNTAESVEIVIQLHPAVSPDQTVDALYAFTNCEMSISPLFCVIQEDKPVFIKVSDYLKASTDHSVALLKAELEIQLKELQEQWHFASLERIFIEHKVYRAMEEAETWEAVLENIWEGLKPHVSHLLRDVIEDDIVRLTEIKIKRISKFDSSKADDQLATLEGKIAEIKHSLAHLIDHAIAYFTALKDKYGKGRARKTELRSFDSVVATQVAMANMKLYVNREEGFVGTGLRKAEYIGDCADIDDLVVILADGTMMVTKVDDKKFIGQDIVHVAVFHKGDERTVYNMIYRDGARGKSFIKRFPIKSITRDKAYSLTQGNKSSKIHHLSVNLNGEAELVTVALRSGSAVRKLKFDADFADIPIRGRSARGKTLTKFAVKRIDVKSKGLSTLAARKVYFEESVMKLNDQERGRALGDFQGEDRLIQVEQSGRFRVITPEFSTHFDALPYQLKKFSTSAYTLVYFDADKSRHIVKRFVLEPKGDAWDHLIPKHPGNRIELLDDHDHVCIQIDYKKVKGKTKDSQTIQLDDFISVKGWKAAGNQLTGWAVRKISIVKTSNDVVEDLVIKENPAIISSPSDPKDMPAEPADTPTESPESKNLDEEGQITLNF